MNGVVSSLYDIDSIVVPEELLKADIDEQKVDAEVQALSKRYAREEQADEAAAGDRVDCQADSENYPDGRTILLYIGMKLPGAEKAEEAVIGKKAGDTVSTVLAEKHVTLKIQKIVRRTPVEVNDALIAGMGIENVKTIEDYKAYIRDKMAADQAMEHEKEVIRYVMDQMIANSTYIYDEKEMEAYIQKTSEQYRKECEAIGEPVEMEEMKQGIIEQCKQYWMAKAFCESKGIKVDLSSVEEETDKMIEMMQLMGEPVPDRAEMLEMAEQDAYLDGLFQYIDTMVEKN